MRVTRGIGVTAALLGVLAASGCGGGSGDDAATTQATSAATSAAPSTSTRSTSSLPTTSSTPTASSTAAGAPGVPEPARQHTKAGAVAFSRYYWDVVNRTAVSPTVGLLEPLASDSCKTCRNFANTVRINVKNDQHFSGPEGRITKAEWRMDGPWLFVQPSQVRLIDNETGKVIKKYPKESPYIWVVSLEWANGWQIVSMQVADGDSW